MTSRFTSLTELIERVYRTTDLESVPWQDCSEDILDVLRLIGVPQAYVEKTTNGQLENPVPIIIENFRGELPNDMAVPGPCRLVLLDSNYNISSFKMMVETSDLFYMSPTVLEEYNTAPTDYASTLVATSLEMKIQTAEEQIDDGDLTDATETLDDIVDDVRQAQGRIVTSATRNIDYTPKYKLNNNYMFTNFKEGFVEMSYKAYPVDQFGMPMVPDEIRFIKAVEWFLISRIDYKKWRSTRNASDERIWRESDKEAAWYIASARSKARSPSLDQMESIKRMMLRSIPKINEFNHAFKYSNSQEQRKF